MGRKRLWPALAAGLGALLLYGVSLAPGLTWAHHGADGGDFLSAALTGGVPHPSGYPTYELLLRLATAVSPAEPARTGNWVSALSAVLATMVVADLAHEMLPETSWRGLIAFAAALTWAASPALWSQAVITEVHALNALFLVTSLWLLWHWRASVIAGREDGRWLIAAGALLGLGMGNHLSLVLVLPAGLICARTARGVRVLSRSTWLHAALAFISGLLVYLYLPLSASANPPVNWGDPQTPARFWSVLTGQLYRPLVFGLDWRYLPGRLGAWANEAMVQFGAGPWGLLLAILGLWWLDREDRGWWWVTIAVAVAYFAFAVGYDAADSGLYLIPAWTMGALWLAPGLAIAVRGIDRFGAQWAESRAPAATAEGRGKQSAPRSKVARYATGAVVLLVLLAMPLASVARFGGAISLRGDREARDFMSAALADADEDAVILTSGDQRTFALWYGIYGLRKRTDLTPINVRLYAFPWYRRTLASHHPQLAQVEDGDLPGLDLLLRGLGERVPLYRAESLNLDLSGYDEQPAGVLVKMSPR